MIILDNTLNKKLPKFKNNLEKLVFLHIPKTGGNCLLRHLTGETDFFKQFNPKSSEIDWKILRKLALDKSIKEVHSWGKWHNHNELSSYAPDELERLRNKGFYFFTVLRNPYERACSLYQWSKSYLKFHRFNNSFLEFLININSHRKIDKMFNSQYFFFNYKRRASFQI